MLRVNIVICSFDYALCDVVITWDCLSAADIFIFPWLGGCICRTDSRFAPSQWETVLLCNDVSNWLGTNLESALICTTASSHHQMKPYPLFGFKSWNNPDKKHTQCLRCSYFSACFSIGMIFNPLPSERCGCNLKLLIFKLMSSLGIMSISSQNCTQQNATTPHW